MLYLSPFIDDKGKTSSDDFVRTHHRLYGVPKYRLKYRFPLILFSVIIADKAESRFMVFLKQQSIVMDFAMSDAKHSLQVNQNSAFSFY